MERLGLDIVWFARAIVAWDEAPHGEKTYVLKKWCSLLGITPSTFHRKIRDFSIPRRLKPSRIDKGKRKNPHIEEWVLAIIKIKDDVPNGAKGLSTYNALQLAIARGNIPKEAANIPLGTINRIAREKGWVKIKTDKKRSKLINLNGR